MRVMVPFLLLFLASSTAHATDFIFEEAGLQVTIPNSCDVVTKVSKQKAKFKARCAKPDVSITFNKTENKAQEGAMKIFAKEPPKDFKNPKVKGPKSMELPGGLEVTGLTFTGDYKGGERLGGLMVLVKGVGGNGLSFLFMGKESEEDEFATLAQKILESVKKTKK